MTLDKEYMEYPKRKYGMDHEWYGWTMQPDRPKVSWPAGNKMALFVVVALEFFPLDQPAQPFKAPGGMVTPYPDLRHYTLRDYGNRVGVFRVAKVLEKHGIVPTVAINSMVAARYPFLVDFVTGKGWEVMGYGVDMGKVHFGGQDEAEETARIQEALGVLREMSGQKVTGWASPAKSESMKTLDLVAAEGIDYVTDWISDEMPFPLTTANGPLTALPLQHEMDDQTIMLQYQHTEDQFVEQLTDQFDVLYREATAEDGRMMTLTIHPWMSGQPHRIGALDRALAHIAGHDGVWSASGTEIVRAAGSQ